MIDVMHWIDGANCSRCGRAAPRYIRPYFDRTKALCPACCRELNELYEQVGWPT